MTDIAMREVSTPPSYQMAIRAFKSAGHTNHTAVGELIDNSIDARAENIHILIDDNTNTIVVADDGEGMDESTLLSALTAGEHNDEFVGTIGKFGMGMKTSACHYGDCLEIITKQEGVPYLKGIFDLDLLKLSKNWISKVGVASSDDIALFNSLVNDEQGTIVRISKIPKLEKDLAKNLRTYVGRTFRRFLKPIQCKNDKTIHGKIKIFINDSEIFGLDPMERYAPNTAIKSVDITLKDGRIIQATISYLSDKDVGANTLKDSGELNFPANSKYQGLYIVRENREILAHDCSTFEHVWGQRHPTLNYCRAELSYSDMDDVFKVNFTKHGIADISQSVLDILERELSHYIRQGATKRSLEETQKKESDELKNYHDASGKIVSAKANILDLPHRKKERRRSGPHHPRVNPPDPNIKPSGRTRTGTNSSKESLQKVKFETWANGTARPLFDFRTEKNVFIIRWNIDHEFYRKYVSTGDETNETKTHVCAVNFLVFVLASILERKSRDSATPPDDFDAEDFISLISNDLSSLAK